MICKDATCFARGRAHVVLQLAGRMLMKTVIMPAMWCTLTGNMWATDGASFPLRPHPTL